MLKTLTGRLAVTGVLALSASAAMAVPMSIDTSLATNGLTDLYSASFDPALSSCAAGSTQSYCGFFGGNAPGSRAISISPDPTGVDAGSPIAIGVPHTAAGSFLDIDLTVGNTLAQIIGTSTISLPPVTLVINGLTTVVAVTAGFAILPSGVESVDANGQVEFLVNNSPGLAADFTTLSAAVAAPGGSCVGGPYCPLIPILSLDMVRYRIFLDFDPTFSSFTGTFIGQTSNNSMLCVNLDSTGSGGGSDCQLAAIPVPAAAWLMASGLGLLPLLRRRVKMA